MSATLTGPVVVGVSPSTGSPSALRWAADYARLRGAPLVAVLAWRPARPPSAPGGRPPGSLLSATSTATDAAVEAEQRLLEYVTVALGDASTVLCRAVHGSPVSALLEAGEQAQLLVIGEPRPGRIASVRASLIAPHLVLRAHCPVVVLPSSPAAGSIP